MRELTAILQQQKNCNWY